MPSSYTSNLRLVLPVQGELSGTWGDTVNAGLTNLTDSSIAGYASVSVTALHQSLTIANGAADQARMAFLNVTTTTGAAFNLYAPPVTKAYTVKNASSYSMTVYNSTTSGGTTPAGTGVTIPAGAVTSIYSDGTNFYSRNTYLPALTVGAAPTFTSPLAVPSGGTGVATLTGVAYGNGTGAFTAATGSQIATAIGTSAVTNATNAVNATTSTTQAAKTADTTIATTAFTDGLRSLSASSTSGTLVLSDRGCLVSLAAGITVPASVFNTNDVVTLFNNTAGTLTITQGSGLTLYWAGVGTTGNRSLLLRGICTVTFISATVAVISGAGVT